MLVSLQWRTVLYQVIGGIVFGLVWCVTVQAADVAPSANVAVSKPASETMQAKKPVPPFELRYENDYLSVKAKSVPLGEILKRFASQADIIMTIPRAEAERVVSRSIDPVPLLEGIRELLEGQSYALLTKVVPATDSVPAHTKISHIRVYASAAGTPMTTITGEDEEASMPKTPADIYARIEAAQPKFSDLKNMALTDADPKQRELAFDEISALRGTSNEEVYDLIRRGMSDPVLDVRGAALELWAGLDPKVIPMDYLVEVAQGDQEPQLRVDALSNMALMYPAEQTVPQLERALNDPDEHVRKQAQYHLERIREESSATEKQK